MTCPKTFRACGDRPGVESEDIQTRENGKALRESLGEMGSCSMWSRYYAGLAAKSPDAQCRVSLGSASPLAASRLESSEAFFLGTRR